MVRATHSSSLKAGTIASIDPMFRLGGSRSRRPIRNRTEAIDMKRKSAVFTAVTSQDKLVGDEALGLAEVDLHAAKVRGAADLFLLHVEPFALADMQLQGFDLGFDEVV